MEQAHSGNVTATNAVLPSFRRETSNTTVACH